MPSLHRWERCTASLIRSLFMPAGPKASFLSRAPRSPELDSSQRSVSNSKAVSSQNSYADGSADHFSISGGKQRSDGAELDVTGKLTSRWDLLFNYAFLQANVIGAAEQSFIPVGTPLPNDPRHGAKLWTVYNLDRGILKNLSLGGGVLGTSYRYSSLATPGEVSRANPVSISPPPTESWCTTAFDTSSR